MCCSFPQCWLRRLRCLHLARGQWCFSFVSITAEQAGLTRKRSVNSIRAVELASLVRLMEVMKWTEVELVQQSGVVSWPRWYRTYLDHSWVVIPSSSQDKFSYEHKVCLDLLGLQTVILGWVNLIAILGTSKRGEKDIYLDDGTQVLRLHLRKNTWTAVSSSIVCHYTMFDQACQKVGGDRCSVSDVLSQQLKSSSCPSAAGFDALCS